MTPPKLNVVCIRSAILSVCIAGDQLIEEVNQQQQLHYTLKSVKAELSPTFREAFDLLPVYGTK